MTKRTQHFLEAKHVDVRGNAKTALNLGIAKLNESWPKT